ncbi:MAG: class I SAM-dependent methyltransferase [Dehalococcoidia bacterium]
MTTTTTSGAVTAEMAGLKERLAATWSAGNYDFFSRFMEPSAAEFLDRLPVRPGTELLDVACGSGQLSLIAARRGARVHGVDLVPAWIEAARGRATAEGLDAHFEVGDAEALPYEDARFDVTATIYGAMFAPRPELVASELLRVTRPGGTIAMANWTKEGFIGQMLATIGRFVAPPGMPSPVLWGDETTVRERFASGLTRLDLERVMYRFEYPFAPERTVEFFREHYGPMTMAFAKLEGPEREGLRDALVALWREANESVSPHRTVVDAEYLQVVGTRA